MPPRIYETVKRRIDEAIAALEKLVDDGPDERSSELSVSQTLTATRTLGELVNEISAILPRVIDGRKFFRALVADFEMLDGKMIELAGTVQYALAMREVGASTSKALWDVRASVLRRIVSIAKTLSVSANETEDPELRLQLQSLGTTFGTAAVASELVEPPSRSATEDSPSPFEAIRSRRHHSLVTQIDEAVIALDARVRQEKPTREVNRSRFQNLILDALEATRTLQGLFRETTSVGTYGEAALQSGNVLPYSEGLTGQLVFLRATASQDLEDNSINQGLLKRIQSATDSLTSRTETIANGLSRAAQDIDQDEVRRELVSISDAYASRVIRSSIVEQAKEARDETFRVLDSAKMAAGEVGATEQARHYLDYATSEHRTADRLRIATVALLIAIAGLAGGILLFLNGQLEVWRELAKLAIALPLAVLAAYLGRESNRHRQRATWARQLGMQLSTFDAFVQPLDEVARIKTRSTFAANIFGMTDPPRSDEEAGPSVIADLVLLIDAARGLARKNGASNDPATSRPKSKSERRKRAGSAP